MIDAEVAEPARHEDIRFIDIGDFGHGRTGQQIVLELVHGVAVALGHDFDPSIGQIADCPINLMTSRHSQNKETISYTLNHPGDQKPSRHNHTVIPLKITKNIFAPLCV